MLQQLLTALPEGSTSRMLAISLIVAGLGLFFWLIGSRFSRSVFTLAGVAIGTLVGLRAPRWFGLEIDAMAFAIGGALVLGLAGYLLHTMWVGMTLGGLLAAVGAFVAWHRLGSGDAVLPWASLSGDSSELANAVWTNFLAKLPKAIPVTASICMSAGGLIAWMWPKVSRVLTFSMLGALMLTGGGAVAMAIGQPGWLGKLPASTQAQGIGLASLMVLGAGVQWMLLPRVRRAAVTTSDDSDERGSERTPALLMRKEARA